MIWYKNKHYNLCIPLKPKKAGGVYTFINTFRNYLDSNQYLYTDNIKTKYDVLLVCAWTTPFEQIIKAKKYNPKLKIVHRVNGAGKDYGRTDGCDEILTQINKESDITIFQSKYSKYATMEKFKIVVKDGPIIYNPTNTELFNPQGKKYDFESGISICNVSWSTNPMKGTGCIPVLAEMNPKIQFHLCGQYQSIPNLPNIHYYGVTLPDKTAEIMRSCHIFLFLAQNEACPNVVIEALASGLPVLYKDSGGTPELVGNCGLPVEMDNFKIQLEKLMGRWDTFSKSARERAIKMFSSEVVCRQYLDVIESLIK